MSFDHITPQPKPDEIPMQDSVYIGESIARAETARQARKAICAAEELAASDPAQTKLAFGPECPHQWEQGGASGAVCALCGIYDPAQGKLGLDLN